jgi:hypothetical protein
MMLAKVAHLFGIARAGLTLARNGAFSPLDPRGLPPMPALALRGLRLIEKPEGQRDMQSFLRHAMRDGFFHADMHPGNLFVEPDGTLVAVDLTTGITGCLGREGAAVPGRNPAYGFITRNYRRTAEVHFEAGYVPAHHRWIDSFAQALRAIGEPIHGRNRLADFHGPSADPAL